MAEAKRKRRWQDTPAAIRAGLSRSRAEDRASDVSTQWRQIRQVFAGFLLCFLVMLGALQGATWVSFRLGLGILLVIPVFFGGMGLFLFVMVRWQTARAKSVGYYHDAQRYELPANLLQLLEPELDGAQVVVEMDSNASFDYAYRPEQGAQFTHGWLSLHMKVAKTYAVTLKIERSGEYQGHPARYKCRYFDQVTIKVRAPEPLQEPPEFPPLAGFASARMRVHGPCLTVKAKTPPLKRKLNRRGLATAAADLKAFQLLGLLQAAFFAIRRQP